jgi:hypothetical protein
MPRESAVYRCSPVTQMAWALLLRTAAWRERMSGGIRLKPGQAIVTAKGIDDALAWRSGCRTSRFGEEAVKHALRTLRELGEIATEAVWSAGKRVTLVTVLRREKGDGAAAAPSDAPSASPVSPASSAAKAPSRKAPAQEDADGNASRRACGRPAYKDSKEENMKERTPCSPPEAGDGSRPPLRSVEGGQAGEGEAEAVCREAVAAWNAAFADRPDMPQAEATPERAKKVRRRLAKGWTLERWRELLAAAKAQPFALTWLNFDSLLSEGKAQLVREGAYKARGGGGCLARQEEEMRAFLAA